MRANLVLAVVFTALFVASPGCVIEDLDLVGRPCPCTGDLVCVEGRCLQPSSMSACTGDEQCDDGHVCLDSACRLASSCAALKKAHAAAPSASYSIAPPGVAPLPVYCDMVEDGGGWMLVTAEMIASEFSGAVSVVKAADARGGLSLTVRASTDGCGAPDSRDKSHHVLYVKDVIPWQSIRAHHRFTGAAICWSLFGAWWSLEDRDPNLVEFDPAKDSIRDQVRMGPTGGDAFDGLAGHCGDADNFWYPVGAERSATVTLRRRTPSSPAGLGIRAECIPTLPSETGWDYDQIYVRE